MAGILEMDIKNLRLYLDIDLGIWAALGRAGMRFSRAPWKRSK